jgi:hypothetical protein
MGKWENITHQTGNYRISPPPHLLGVSISWVVWQPSFSICLHLSTAPVSQFLPMFSVPLFDILESSFSLVFISYHSVFMSSFSSSHNASWFTLLNTV